MQCRRRFYKSHNLRRRCPQCGKMIVFNLYAYRDGRRHCSRKCMALSMSKHRMDDQYILSYVKSHVKINHKGCWVFTGSSGGAKPHPQIKIGGRYYPVAALVFKAVGKSKTAVPVKGSKVYCHKCGHNRCVNPDHTYIGMPQTPLYHHLNKPYIRRLIRKSIVVDPDTKCWWWTCARTNKGYGEIQVEHRHFMAHRLSIWAFKDKEEVLKSSKPVCHNCDNPACVNPSHLRLDTQRENVLDSIRRGRHGCSGKTCCKYGHPYNEKNTVIKKSTSGGITHKCRICEANRDHTVQRKIASRITYLQKYKVKK